MIIFAIFIPAIMILIGGIWKSNPPKDINSLYGYRTRMSMLNKDTWDFAHRLISKIWLVVGFLMFIFTIIAYILIEDKAEAVIIISLVQILIMLLTIIPVEIELKKKFDKKGNLK